MGEHALWEKATVSPYWHLAFASTRSSYLQDKEHYVNTFSFSSGGAWLFVTMIQRPQRLPSSNWSRFMETVGRPLFADGRPWQAQVPEPAVKVAYHSRAHSQLDLADCLRSGFSGKARTFPEYACP